MDKLSPVEEGVNFIYASTILQDGAKGISEFERRVTARWSNVSFPQGFVTPQTPIRDLAAYVENNIINMKGMRD